MPEEATESKHPVTLEVQGDIAVVRFDDGGVNAMSFAFLDSALAAFKEAAEAKAVVIAGNGKCLSAGFDLNEVVKGPEQRDAIINAGGELFYSIFTCPKPVVIACTGHAMAGGVVYLLTSDVRIGRAGKYKYGFNEVLIGVPMPEFGIALTQYRVASPMVEPILLGEVLNAEGARAAGLLDSVVDGDENDVTDAAIAKATELATRPLDAYATTKMRSRAHLLERFKTA